MRTYFGACLKGRVDVGNGTVKQRSKAIGMLFEGSWHTTAYELGTLSEESDEIYADPES